MIKSAIQNLAHRMGLEVQPYSLQVSNRARLQKLLNVHHIDQVLDIGANIGTYSRYLRNMGYKGHILSFEPLTSAYDRLLKSSQGDDRWQVAPPMAIGDRDGEIALHIAGNSESSSILPMLDTHVLAAPESSYIAQETVPIHQLDTVLPSLIALGDRRIFMKLDVQGYEAQALQGAKNVLTHILGIQTELSLVPLYQDQLLYREMIDQLETLGYSLQGVIPGYTDPKTGQMLQVDGIFIRS